MRSWCYYDMGAISPIRLGALVEVTDAGAANFGRVFYDF